MTQRTYRQLCTIAYALDVVGERWTLLIVRELRFGPRRFTDLKRALDGIGAHLLTKRLKQMQAADIIEQRKLPPPAATSVYGLTERGKALEPVILALRDWGTPLMFTQGSADDCLTVASAMGALKNTFFSAERAHDLKLMAEIHAQGDVFTVIIVDGEIDVRFGLADGADLVFSAELKPLLAIFNQRLTVESAIAKEMIALQTGSQMLLTQFLNCFAVPNQEDK